MKHFARLLSILILVSAGFYLSNCGGKDDPKPSPQEVQTGLLKGTWKISSATLDGTAKPEFVGAKLTIQSNLAFTFAKGDAPAAIDASPWPASGSLAFGSNVETDLILTASGADPVPITYSVSASSLQTTFTNYDGESYSINGRTMSVAGTWVFTFAKQ